MSRRKILENVDRLYVGLVVQSDVPLDFGVALVFGWVGSDVGAHCHATRLVADSYDVRDICGSFRATKDLSKKHYMVIRTGVGNKFVKGLDTCASSCSRDNAYCASSVARQQRANVVDL